jgi:hypothetical protein
MPANLMAICIITKKGNALLYYYLFTDLEFFNIYQ